MSQVSQTQVDLEGLEQKIYRRSHSYNSVKTFRASVKVIQAFLETRKQSLADLPQQNPYRIVEALDTYLDDLNYRSNPKKQHRVNIIKLMKMSGVKIDKDTMKDAAPLPKKQIFVDEALTPETARTILLETRQPDLRLLLCLEKDTLARPEEIVSLKLGNINLASDPSYLKIPEYAAKNNIEREAFFTQETKEILISYLQKRGVKKQEEYIFLNNGENLDPLGDEKKFQRRVSDTFMQMESKWHRNRNSSPALQQIIKKLERRGRRNTYTIHIYSFKKFGFTKYADAISELAAHATAGHEEYLITYYKKSREDRVVDFNKVKGKLQLFTTPTDLEKQQQAVEQKIKSLPPEALVKVLQYLNMETAKEADRRL